MTDTVISRKSTIFTREKALELGLKWCWVHQGFEPIEHFGKSKNRPGGLQPLCRQAQIEQRRRKLFENPTYCPRLPKPQETQFGMKWCAFHQQFCQIISFGKDSRKIDGLQSTCRKGQAELVGRTSSKVSKYNPAPTECKWCSFHKRFERLENFGKQKKTKRDPSGLQARCREGASISSGARNLERYKTDLSFKLKMRIRTRIGQVLKKNKIDGVKSGSAVNDLGCSIPDLIVYIEKQFKNGMAWENIGKIWQIDHCRPLALFDLTDRNQFLEACNYTNLQPLLVDDHAKKTTKDIYIIKLAKASANKL